MRLYPRVMGTVQWGVRIFAAVLMGAVLAFCIIRGYIAGGILAGFGFAAALYVLYIRAIYIPRLRAKVASASVPAGAELADPQ